MFLIIFLHIYTISLVNFNNFHLLIFRTYCIWVDWFFGESKVRKVILVVC